MNQMFKISNERIREKIKELWDQDAANGGSKCMLVGSSRELAYCLEELLARRKMDTTNEAN